MRPSTSQLLKTCASLIEFPSTDENPIALGEIVHFIHIFFQDVPVHIVEVEHGGYLSIVISTMETQSPDIMLHGHVDVVPAAPSQFRPKVVDEKLFGRGAVDMKGFVAVAMHVIRDLALSAYPPNVALMINTDEEIGGRNGAKALVADGWKPRQLINGDGGYGDALTFAQKGIIQLELTASTDPGTRTSPWNGGSAAELLAAKLSEGLQELCPRQAEMTSDDNWGSTACVLSVESEPNGNLPPKKATASVRLYWAESQTGDEVIKMAQRAFYPLQVEGVVDAERVYLSPEDPDLLYLRDLWQTHLGREIGIRADNGSSDAKWFTPLDIPILILRMPGGGAHTEKEWLETSALEPLYQTLYEYMVEKSSKPVSLEESSALHT